MEKNVNDNLKRTGFWWGLSKKKRILVIVAVILIGSLLSGGADSVLGGGKVKNEKAAEKLVRELFPEADKIAYQGKHDTLSGYFNVDVGEWSPDYPDGLDRIEVYVYTVVYTGEIMHCWVAEDGKVAVSFDSYGKSNRYRAR